MDIEINKCPYCKGVSVLTGRKLKCVTCTSCHASGPVSTIGTEAILKWNNLVPTSEISEEDNESNNQ
jgi:Zn-finger nucleic acid-binding protein